MGCRRLGPAAWTRQVLVRRRHATIKSLRSDPATRSSGCSRPTESAWTVDPRARVCRHPRPTVRVLNEALDRPPSTPVARFASIYGEWQSQDAAETVRRAFHESMRFRMPPGPVQVLLEASATGPRLPRGLLILVDPRDPAIDRAGPLADQEVWAVQSGPPATSRSAAPRRRLHRRQGQVACGCPSRRRCSQSRHSRRRRSALQRLGHRHPAERAVQAAIGRLRTAARDPRHHDALARALRARLRQPPLARDRRRGSLRVRGGTGVRPSGGSTTASPRWPPTDFTPYVFVHKFGHHFTGLADSN